MYNILRVETYRHGQWVFVILGDGTSSISLGVKSSTIVDIFNLLIRSAFHESYNKHNQWRTCEFHTGYCLFKINLRLVLVVKIVLSQKTLQTLKCLARHSNPNRRRDSASATCIPHINQAYSIYYHICTTCIAKRKDDVFFLLIIQFLGPDIPILYLSYTI